MAGEPHEIQVAALENNNEACIGVLGIQDIWILSILLPGIQNTVSNILVTFRDIALIEKIIVGIFASL